MLKIIGRQSVRTRHGGIRNTTPPLKPALFAKTAWRRYPSDLRIQIFLSHHIRFRKKTLIARYYQNVNFQQHVDYFVLLA